MECSRCRKASAESTIGIDLTRIGPGSRLWMETGTRPRVRRGLLVNPDYAFDPIVGIQLVLRRDGRVLPRTGSWPGASPIPEVLRASLPPRPRRTRLHARAKPFLHELHAAMLRKLERLFLRHFAPGSRVLDAGCGRSLFTEIRPGWPFGIVAADVDLDLLAARKAEFPAVRWVVGDAHPLPFRDGAFDGLFAGELIEHLPDPEAGVEEFRRVLRPGGTLVLTTPNRLRLANVVDRSERPYSPDHLSELSYDEARALLRARGFTILEESGLHLELLLNWLSPLPKLDRLQRKWNRSWAVPLMRALLAAGALVPRYALDLVFVARRD